MRKFWIIILCLVVSAYARVDGFPVSFGVDSDMPLWGAPAFVQIDSTPFIIVASTNDSLYAFELDATVAEGFPIHCGGPVRSKIAWIPKEHYLSIFILTADGIISRIDYDGLTASTIFDTSLGEYSNYISPVVDDIDADGELEIICAVDTTIFCLTLDGAIEWTANFVSEVDFAVATPACGDLDNDGKSELVVLGYRTVNVFTESGVELPGFPVQLDDDEAFSYSSPLLFDYDRDGQYEIFCGAHRLSGGEYGIIKAYRNDGTEINDPFYTTYTYGSWIYSPLTLGDVNGDYSLDICFGNVPGEVYGINTSAELVSFGGTGRGHPGHIYGSILLCDLDNVPGPEYVFQLIQETESIATMIIMDPGANDLADFPDTLESTRAGILTPAIYSSQESTFITAVTADGNLYLWEFENIPLPGFENWTELYGDRQNRNIAPPHNVVSTVTETLSNSYKIDWGQATSAEFMKYILYVAEDSVGNNFEIIAEIEDVAETTYIYESDIPAESLWFFIVVKDSMGRTSLRSVPKSARDTSDIQWLDCENNIENISISPNPFNSSCVIKSPKNCVLKIYNIKGETICSICNTDGNYTFDSSLLRSGIFIIRAFDNHGKPLAETRAILIK
ncbi:hypothetical protein DRQ33_00505 [bacterium]|nr:MAG: hypothetical protein DRQ33_00505 [bacterium]